MLTKYLDGVIFIEAQKMVHLKRLNHFEFMIFLFPRNRNDLLNFAFGRAKCHIIHLIRLGDHIQSENHFKCKLYLEMSTPNKQV